jgi:hypothetical protein
MSPLFGKKKRFVVTNLFVAVDASAFLPVLTLCARAEQRIVASDGNFDVASEQIAKVAGGLIDQREHWTHAALFGDVVDDEGQADAVAQEAYADMSTRYLSAGDDDDKGSVEVEVNPGERRAVAMLTVAFEGEEAALERDVENVVLLEESLQKIVALHHQGRLLVAHVHHAPAHPEDKLTDEQLLVNYPELMTL